MAILEDGKMPKTVRAKLNYTAASIKLIMHNQGFMPEIGVVLGSGLGNFAERALIDPFPLPYDHIPHFPKPTVEGHAGQMWWGKIGERRVVIMQGRVHGYEGYRPDEIVFPVRLMIALGAKKIVLTNAVGGLNGNLTTGDLVVVKDHISFLYPFNPLVGLNDQKLGKERFPKMHNAYDSALREHALTCLKKLGLQPHTGVYAAVSGPQFETQTEVRLLQAWGADIVGMSVVPETIAAVHMGAKVVAVSCVTNMGAGLCDNRQPFNFTVPETSHEGVLAVGKKNEKKFAEFMTLLVSTMPA